MLLCVLVAAAASASATAVSIRAPVLVASCPNTSDCTSSLQIALDSCASVVIPLLPNSAPWIVRPLRVSCNNQAIVLDPGVKVFAKYDEFHGNSDCLLTIQNVSGVSISGYGAQLQMRRRDYADPTVYSHSEGRHGIAIRGSSAISITGLIVSDTGGDGLYVANNWGEHSTNSRNVTVRDVVSTRNYRQGMSVIGVNGLVVENTILSYTNGTPPMAGVDFEPNFDTNELSGIRFRNVSSIGNMGRGIQFSLTKMKLASLSLDAVFEDCSVEGGSFGVSLSGSSTGLPLGGQLKFRNLSVVNTQGAGLLVESKNGGPLLTIEHAKFSNVAVAGNNKPMWIEGRTRVCGNVSFQDVEIIDNKNRAPVLVQGDVEGIRGTLQVHNTAGCTPKNMSGFAIKCI